MEYKTLIFANGRIVLISEEDYEAAIKLGQEILISCGGWSGGYACAIGATKYGDEWHCYSYEVKDRVFTTEEMQKYYKVIFTDGIRVYMKTGESANQYSGHKFIDYHTSYKDFCSRFDFDGETEQEFEALRFCVNIDRTKRTNGLDEDQWNAIKRFL